MILCKQNWVAGFLILLVITCYTWATWQFFTEPIPGGNDFMAHYTAWEAFLKHGHSPYSDEAALYTQNAIYGRAAMAGEDQNRLTYPFYSGLVHAPFILVDYALSRAIYMTLLQIALFVGVVMVLDLVKWHPSIWLLGIVLVWALIYYPQARGIILGQFAIFGFFSLAASLFFLKRRQDILAGAILVLSTVKPTLVFLVVPFLIAWAFVRRRRNFIWGFAVILAVLMLGSFVVLPSWLGEWVARMMRYSGYTIGQSPVWLLTHVLLPGLGNTGEIVITGLLLIVMLWTWWLAFRPNGETRFIWSLGITLVVSNLIVPRSATTNYVMMLVPTLWVFAALERTPVWGKPVLLVGMLVSFVGLWWLHYATVVGNQEQPILFIPSPLALGLVLLLGYRWLMNDARQNDLAL